MASYTMSSREIPVNDDYDVIVCGGGPSGCTAAAAAARAGAKTLLLEATGCLGGMGTGALVPAWCPFTDKKRVIYGGMAAWMMTRSMAEVPHLKRRLAAGQVDWVPIDPELVKRLYDELVTDNGADVLFNAFTTAVEASDGSVDALIVASKAGLTAYRATTYVDCSGDADIVAWAGGAFLKGDEEDGALQPATHCFRIANVDMYAYEHMGTIQYGKDPKDEWKIYEIMESGKYPEIPDAHAANAVVGPGVIGFNGGHIWDVDNTDPFSVSRALIEGRKMAKAFRDAFAEFFPEAFGNGYLVQTGSLMGIRETRRIVGDYQLTFEDFINARTFDDEIARNAYPIDLHMRKSELGTDKEEMGPALAPGESHGIPLRCLLPVGLRNVIVAGRSASADRSAMASIRVMPVCLAMGEAAGTAAAMSVAHGGTLRAIDVDALRADLRAHGAYLP